jgi:hypothetical protein
MLVLDGGSFGSTRVAGLIGHYNLCLFGSRTDANPAPLAEAGVVDCRFHNFRGNRVHCHDCASAILVDPHLIIDVVHHNAPLLHPSTNLCYGIGATLALGTSRPEFRTHIRCPL